jgi:hypothetical protein
MGAGIGVRSRRACYGTPQRSAPVWRGGERPRAAQAIAHEAMWNARGGGGAEPIH